MARADLVEARGSEVGLRKLDVECRWEFAKTWCRLSCSCPLCVMVCVVFSVLCGSREGVYGRSG